MTEMCCAACGAKQEHNTIRCEQCGQPLVFPTSFLDDWPGPAPEAYIDESFDERACDYCGKLYRGPAVYCSLECATDDL